MSFPILSGRSSRRCCRTSRAASPRADDRKVLNGIYWRLRTGSPWAEIPERYGPADDVLQSLCPLGEDRRLGPDVRGDLEGLRRRPADDRQLLDPRSPAWRERQKGGSEETPAAAGDVARSPLHGALAGRPDHQNPCPRRRQRPAHSSEADRQARLTTDAAPPTCSDGLGEGQILLADRGYDSDALREKPRRAKAPGATSSPCPVA